ncbi:hypothetical protein PF010_g19985 [Phytophthora fragariae]|uniref:Pectinesterase n=1 Tax=Phytophthora fragariae TaxID=53985 RepID=A0A6A3DRV3_9STRA|nr:hypothetical protein PF003_g26754 [Phytophthora fragariae]KAE8923745.1 hypothetical protein PF009_g26007 [Phytophthora fragariae]KAE8991436.1 hypothetical protein PF011_g17947 [Phytophthora fragariae]KAE9086720.1 hypothetical protein PF010_g19985 [Phytophthora fragariae]KAE9221124.1 hypothetical protein PF004_g13138 [Phytophthora fragariae]
MVFVRPGVYHEQVLISRLASPLVLQGYTCDAKNYASNQVTIGCGRFSSTFWTISKYRLKFAPATIKTADGVEYRIKSDDLSSTVELDSIAKSTENTQG